MSRSTALSVLIIGGVLEAVGAAGIAFALTRPGGNGLLAVFIPLAVAGLVALVVGATGLARAAKTSPARGPESARFPENRAVHRALNDSPYTTHYSPPVTGKNARPSALRVSLPAPALPDLRVTGETGFDRLAKRFGLAVEVDTGDAEFDAECYVTSDATEFVEQYLADPVKRIGVLELRRAGFGELVAAGGTLTAVWTGFNPTAHDHPELLELTAARLKVLTLDLPDAPAVPVGHGRRRFWAAVLWLLLFGYAAAFVAFFLYPPVRGWELAVRVIGVVLTAGPAFALLAVFLLRGTSSSHRSWLALVLGGLPLFPLGSVGSVSLTNAALDTAPAVEHQAVIVEKYTRRHKNSTTYHVLCRAWRADAETEKFSVSKGEYDRVVPHQSKMVVTTRPGLWGVEWVHEKRVEVR